MIQKLVETLQALAAPAHLQLERFPDFVCKADELALDYYDALVIASGCPQLQLTDEQRASLRQVDDLLAEMSGDLNAPLWTERALREAAEWAALRRAAVDALRTLGQPYPAT